MWQKIQLYIISLWFLFVLLFINKIPYCYGESCQFVGIERLFSEFIVVIFCAFFILLGLFFYRQFNYKVERGAQTNPKSITRIESLNFETLSFLATYVVPLVCFDLDFDLDKGRNFLMLILVLILIGFIYIKANIFYTNPTLAVLGYKIYKVDTGSLSNVVIIAREKLELGNSIRTKLIDENIYFATKIKNE